MKLHAKSLKVICATVFISLPAGFLNAGAPLPQDVVTVGIVNGPQFSVVDVPVYIRDTSSTPLGLDQPAGSRIQSYSIKVNYAPASVSHVIICR